MCPTFTKKLLTLPRLPTRKTTIISTSEDPTSSRASRSALSLYPSDDDIMEEPQPKSRKPAKQRLGARLPGHQTFDLTTPHWWRDSDIIQNQQIRDGVAAELNKVTKRAEKLEYGITKKDQEIQGLKSAHAATLSKIATESDRVLERQRTRIKTLERDNAYYSKKLSKKSKQVKKLKKMMFSDSDSSSS